MKRLALITGAASGIGAATAQAFLAAGWEVVGIDIQSPEQVPRGMRFRQLDLRQPGQMASMWDWFADQTDRLHALVNNASVQVSKSILETTLEDWDALFAINLRSIHLLVRAAYPYLQAAAGAIVNVASVHAIATSANLAAYASSKGALLALTRALAIEFGGEGVRVNAVLPGAVDTPMLRQGLARGQLAAGSVDDQLAALAARTVCGRVGRPEEIAAAILFLADSDKSSFITGHGLAVDGGATVRPSTE